MLFQFLKSTKNPLRQEAMHILKKLYKNEKIRIITESAKFLNNVGEKIGRTEVESLLDEIEKSKLSQEESSKSASQSDRLDDQNPPFITTVPSLVDPTTKVKHQLDLEVRPKESYTYDELKEFKAKLDARQNELNQKEKELEEAKKSITKNVFDLERREVDAEKINLEKDILLKEKAMADEEKAKLSLIVSKLKVENEQIMAKMIVMERKNREGKETGFDTAAVKELKRELEKAQMLNETMKFKYNDYDRLMQDLLKANEGEKRATDDFDKLRAYTESIEEKFFM